MRIVVCEDNDLERHIVLKALEELGYADVIELHDGMQLYEFIKNNHADVILLDIGMPGMDGMKAATLIRKINENVSIIFITAFEHFALDAFGVYAADYIVKPVNARRLKNSLERLKDGVYKEHEHILQLKNRQTVFNIKEQDIIFIEKCLHKSIVNTTETCYEVTTNLKELEESLDPQLFRRTHNGFIVNASKISRIEPRGNMVYVIYFNNTTKTALLSRRKKKNLLK